METLLNRFLKYVSFDTQSDETSDDCPSTEKQFKLANYIKEELEQIGLSNVVLDDNCYLMAELPSNCGHDAPVIGLIAHFDTSPDFSAENVNPQIWKKYDGKDIILSKENDIVLKVSEFPELEQYIGQTIITTDGMSLLGSDDKAGVAEIVSAVEYLITNPDIKHGKIMIAFTPDEEIGRGADKFDVNKFGADFAFTVDGGMIGELEYENFNAAKVKVNFKGRNVHPGTAKNKMINAIELAIRFTGMLPACQKPEYTDDYEGFFHLISFTGEVEESELVYIVRDHDMEKFNEKKKKIRDIAEFLNIEYSKEAVNVQIKNQYLNMKEKIMPIFQIVDMGSEAMKECGVEPLIKPIRGGTDGSRLSFMGLPTPNVFAGGHNFHGRYEYIPLESMQKAVEVVVKICEKTAALKI